MEGFSDEDIEAFKDMWCDKIYENVVALDGVKISY
jgi:hypothetical protein